MLSTKRSTAVLTTSAASQVTALPLGGGLTLELLNRGATAAELVFFQVGDANVTAFIPAANAPGSRFLHPVSGGYGLPLTVQIDPLDTHIAYIAASGTPTVYVTRGRDGV